MATLADYLTDTRALLRDENAANFLVSTADLTAFINKAIQKRDVMSRVLRAVYAFPFVAQVYRYPIAVIASQGTLLMGAAALNVVDTLSVTYNVTVGAASDLGTRVPLGRKPYSWMSWLLSTSWPSFPQWYCHYGPGGNGTMVVAVPPAQAYPCEWDFFGYQSALAAPGSVDACPYPYTEPIPFVAAARAKLQLQKFEEAQALFAQALDNTRFALVGAAPLAVANPWSDLPRGVK